MLKLVCFETLNGGRPISSLIEYVSLFAVRGTKTLLSHTDHRRQNMHWLIRSWWVKCKTDYTVSLNTTCKALHGAKPMCASMLCVVLHSVGRQ